MAITRVWIEDGCVSCGLSESNCPEVFKVKDEGSTVIEGVDYIVDPIVETVFHKNKI